MPAAPHIVLVHGLGRTRFDMGLLARRLRHQLPESSIHTFGYPTRSLTLEQAATRLGHFVDSITTSELVSFVGHSLGGIVVRALDLSAQSRAPLHRLVTLGSPHNGATIARFLARYKLPRSFFGPVLTELGELSPLNAPRQLEIGCVIGATGTRFGFFPIFGADNDGLVLTSEASFPGCCDQISCFSFHGAMPFSKRLSQLSARFLAEGTFR
jgi:hypothetical protein